ncbi:MAG: tRNA (adenosine(37)-N6)-threonylcarbamoyltransferase complex dimerization subunit type 1 TsaB [Rubricoccaceae bacterium]
MLLAIETATDVCSVALVRDGALLAEASLYAPRQHATRLAPLVADLFAHAGCAPAALEAVAVSAGPGSYTGLRIGLSTAKGLCVATGAALVGVPSLEAQALALDGHAAPGEVVAAAFRSRRGEVYAAAYRLAEDARPEAVAPPAAVPEDALAGWLPPGIAWTTGGAAAALAPYVPTARHVAAPPAAARVARVAQLRLAAGDTDDLERFEPAYLKPFVATRPAR